MIAQMEAVTGRKPKRRYIDIINERTPYLPGLYAAKEAREYRDEMADLERERFEEETQRAEEALKIQKKQGKEANTLGMINLGLTGGLGYARNKILKDTIISDSGGITSGGGVVSSGPMGLDKATTTGIVESGTSSIAPSIGSQIGTAFTKPGTYGYGGLGALSGKFLGGKNKTKSALIGGGVGFAANLLSGGSITESIISGVLGGFGGGLF